jgi:two-component system, LytTR family, sensor kinase
MEETISQTASNRDDRNAWLASRGITALVLFVFWTAIGILFALSWYLPSGAEGKPIPFRTAAIWNLLDSYVWLALCPLIVFLHRRFPIQIGSRLRYLWHGALAVGVALTHFAAFICLDRLLDPAFPTRFETVQRATAQLIYYRTTTGVVTYALILSVLSARDFYAGFRSERERRATLEYQLARAHLVALKMQLQPHFLFNALHSVSALIEESPQEAIRMVTKLGAFLRLTLESTEKQMVSLEEEIRFLELYFAIEKVRVGDRVRFLVEIDPRTRSALVPNMILQPLVENALRHGPWREVSDTSVSVVSRALGNSLEIIVRNETAEAPAENRNPVQEGVGLANVRWRLQQLYPTRFRFQYGWISAGLFEVALLMPLEGKFGTA